MICVFTEKFWYTPKIHQYKPVTSSKNKPVDSSTNYSKISWLQKLATANKNGEEWLLGKKKKAHVLVHSQQF